MGDGIDEVAVVRDEQQPAGQRRERLLEPADGLEVEVVGGLVEHEHVRPADEQAPECGTHAPASRELARVALRVTRREPEACQGALRVPIERVATELLVSLARVRVAVHQRLGALHVRRLELELHRGEVALEHHEVIRALAHQGEQRRVTGREVGSVLLEPPDAQVARPMHLAHGRPETSDEGAQQGRLAHPVAADERDTLPDGDTDVDSVEQHATTDLDGESRRAQHVLSRSGQRASGAPAPSCVCASARRTHRSRPSRGSRPTDAARPRRRAAP